MILVDGSRSLELVRAELALNLAAHAARGVELFTAGRQATSVALHAAAQAHRGGGGGPVEFTLARVSDQQLAAVGLEPPLLPPGGRHGDKKEDPALLAAAGGREGGEHEDNAGAGDTEDGHHRRRGLRLSCRPGGRAGAGEEGGSWDEMPVAGVLRVSASSPPLSLAKAVASTVARVPEGSVAAIETALRGKAKSRWTRTYRLAQAVAQAHEWQVEPKNAKLVTRPFRCVASVVVSEDEVDTAAESEEVVHVLRLTLLPEGPAAHRPVIPVVPIRDVVPVGS